MVAYGIYQTSVNYKFLPWEIIESMFSIDDYNEVYEGKLAGISESEADYPILEKIFHKINVNPPRGLMDKVLSTGDVVEIKRKGEKRYYYRNILTWKRIDEPEESPLI